MADDGRSTAGVPIAPTGWVAARSPAPLSDTSGRPSTVVTVTPVSVTVTGVALVDSRSYATWFRPSLPTSTRGGVATLIASAVTDCSPGAGTGRAATVAAAGGSACGRLPATTVTPTASAATAMPVRTARPGRGRPLMRAR